MNRRCVVPVSSSEFRKSFNLVLQFFKMTVRGFFDRGFMNIFRISLEDSIIALYCAIDYALSTAGVKAEQEKLVPRRSLLLEWVIVKKGRVSEFFA
ncbi:MAG: hypothetical protein N2234_03120 [Planctomycetota bacterium]|nr:hypothetical protein [Planctomycetota bacterium]